MKYGNGFCVLVYCNLSFVHIDVITITLSMPEAHQASSSQTATVNHAVEEQLGIIKDFASLQT